MILIGQFDSPFVRRTAVAMNHHGIAFERKLLSVFKDFDEMLEEQAYEKARIAELGLTQTDTINEVVIDEQID